MSNDNDDKISFVGEPMSVSEFGGLMKRANEIKAEGKDPHKVLGGEALRYKAERIITTQPDPVERAQTTLSHFVGSGGKLTEEQSAKFCDYLGEAIEEERVRWEAANWKQHLWYRMRSVWYRIRGWSIEPFGIKVVKFKRRNKSPTKT